MEMGRYNWLCIPMWFLNKPTLLLNQSTYLYCKISNRSVHITMKNGGEQQSQLHYNNCCFQKNTNRKLPAEPSNYQHDLSLLQTPILLYTLPNSTCLFFRLSHFSTSIFMLTCNALIQNNNKNTLFLLSFVFLSRPQQQKINIIRMYYTI